MGEKCDILERGLKNKNKFKFFINQIKIVKKPNKTQSWQKHGERAYCW
jgi:hypothetical protein